MTQPREYNSPIIKELLEESRHLNEGVKLERCSFTFNQEGNGNGTTEEYEELVIECESSLGIDNDDGCFYVLKTTTGWSMDKVDDLQSLFDRIQKAIKR
jgi:hypothetical protein